MIAIGGNYRQAERNLVRQPLRVVEPAFGSDTLNEARNIEDIVTAGGEIGDRAVHGGDRRPPGAANANIEAAEHRTGRRRQGLEDNRRSEIPLDAVAQLAQIPYHFVDHDRDRFADAHRAEREAAVIQCEQNDVRRKGRDIRVSCERNAGDAVVLHGHHLRCNAVAQRARRNCLGGKGDRRV